MSNSFSRHTLRFKLFLTFSLLTLVICATLSGLYLWREIHSYRQRTGEKAQILATFLAGAVRLPLFADDREALARIVAETAGYAGVKVVTVTTAAGNLVARAGQPSNLAREATISRDASVRAISSTGSPEEPMGLVTDGGAVLGRVRVTMDNAEMGEFIRALIVTTILTALFFWVVVSVLSYYVVAWVTRSLTLLITGISAMREGDYSTRIPLGGRDELTETAVAVNDLAEALQQRDAENDRLHRELVESMRSEVSAERRKMMAKLIQTNRMTSLGLLVAGMAHEINTPNAAIRLAGQQVARTWRDVVPILNRVVEEEGSFYLGGVEYEQVREEVNTAAAVIVRSAERIDRVVKDLRNYNLGERQALDDRVDVNYVVAEALSIVRSQGGRSNITLVSDPAQGLIPVPGNRYQLEQVVTNLLLNSTQAIPEGRPGTVTVSTVLDTKTGEITITVTDDGVGIAPDIMPDLLEPFFSTRIEQGGSGLGLYISNYIITEHHGRLTFTSEPGQGTSVTVSLPQFTSPTPPVSS